MTFEQKIKQCWLQIQRDQPRSPHFSIPAGWHIIQLTDGTIKVSDRQSYGGGDQVFTADDHEDEIVDHWWVDTVDFVNPDNGIDFSDDGTFRNTETGEIYTDWQSAWDWINQGSGPDDEFDSWWMAICNRRGQLDLFFPNNVRQRDLAPVGDWCQDGF